MKELKADAGEIRPPQEMAEHPMPTDAKMADFEKRLGILERNAKRT